VPGERCYVRAKSGERSETLQGRIRAESGERSEPVEA
jgi:hypothetical protein